MGLIKLLPKKVTPLLKLTSEITEIPLEKVERVINFKYKKLREWIELPETPVFWDVYIGKFIILKSKLYKRMAKLVKQMRESDDEELREEFRKLWKLRIDLYNYTEKKKTKNANLSRLQSTNWYTPKGTGEENKVLSTDGDTSQII
jgi:hypothetical protein